MTFDCPNPWHPPDPLTQHLRCHGDRGKGERAKHSRSLGEKRLGQRRSWLGSHPQNMDPKNSQLQWIGFFRTDRKTLEIFAMKFLRDFPECSLKPSHTLFGTSWSSQKSRAPGHSHGTTPRSYWRRQKASEATVAPGLLLDDPWQFLNGLEQVYFSFVRYVYIYIYINKYLCRLQNTLNWRKKKKTILAMMSLKALPKCTSPCSGDTIGTPATDWHWLSRNFRAHPKQWIAV